jgi:hypothetical protein
VFGAQQNSPGGRFVRTIAIDESMRISHEAIYQALVRSRSRRFAPRADGLFAHRAGPAGEARPSPEIMISQCPVEAAEVGRFTHA